VKKRAGSLAIALLIACAGLIADTMPSAQQTELIQKYCAVCHNDAHLNGGMSLQHFDAAHPDPTIAAMLMSKLTSLSVEKVLEASTDPTAAALVVKSMKNGAMGAAGLPVPDRATQDALVAALAIEAAGAREWTGQRTGTLTSASILKEMPSTAFEGTEDMYRLSLTCDSATHDGEMIVAFGPGSPGKGTILAAAVDGGAATTYDLFEIEKTMFHGATGKSGTGAVRLAPVLPQRTLTISNVFANETVEFSFDGLAQTARRELAACLTPNARSTY
jgi:hypothetical protein